MKTEDHPIHPSAPAVSFTVSDLSMEDGRSSYRRFTRTLGISVGLLAVLLSLVTFWACASFVLKDTIELTEAAVKSHFGKIEVLRSLFQGAKPGAATQDDHNHNHQESASGSQNITNLIGIVRMHFDLYGITETTVFTADGRVRLSYDTARMGKQADAEELRRLRAVSASGKIEHDKTGEHLLKLWIPIFGDDGQAQGMVTIERDITEQDQQIRKLQFTLLAVMMLGLLVLFFALRQVFISSARTIDRKNRELGGMIAAIERTYDESLQALSGALDSRDNETQGHSYRVTAYALRLGVEMGLPEWELADLARGALLHDVGKIGVPDRILLKPGQLTEEEWTVMKSHVQIGYHMLSHIAFLKPSLDVVKYHHERWDGKGYPFGKKGKEIPLYALIFSICDTYDAMISDRPYRKGMSYTQARAEIERCAGTQFCPDVAAAFLRIPPEEWLHIHRSSLEAPSGAWLEQMMRKYEAGGRDGRMSGKP